jgi:phosphoglycerol transferase MdoB-like AlkP superfamily enzyme
MFDWTLVILTIPAIIIEIIAIIFLFWILSRTKGKLRTSFVFIIITLFILLIRSALNFTIFQSSYIDNSFILGITFFLLLAIVNYFRSIHELTDVKVDEYRKEEHLRPQHKKFERREVIQNYHKPEIRQPARTETVSQLIKESKGLEREPRNIYSRDNSNYRRF